MATEYSKILHGQVRKKRWICTKGQAGICLKDQVGLCKQKALCKFEVVITSLRCMLQNPPVGSVEFEAKWILRLRTNLTSHTLCTILAFNLLSVIMCWALYLKYMSNKIYIKLHGCEKVVKDL